MGKPRHLRLDVTLAGLRLELRRSSALDALVAELQITEEVVARKEVEDSAAE